MIKSIVLASVDNKYKDTILDFIANEIKKSEKKRIYIQRDAGRIIFHIPFWNTRSWSPFHLYLDGTIYISDADDSSFLLKNDVKFPNAMFYHCIFFVVFFSLSAVFAASKEAFGKVELLLVGIWIFFCFALLMLTMLFSMHKEYILFFKNSIRRMMENEMT